MKWFPRRLVLLVCMAAGLSAQTPNQSKPNASDCDNAVTTADMRKCEASRYAMAQQELESAYQSLKVHLDPAQKEKLQTTQRAWFRYRDANADFQASLAQGGTLAPLIKISSLTEMTKARAEELRKQAKP